MQKYVILEKEVGETPLSCLEKNRPSITENYWLQMPLLQELRRRIRIWVYGDKPNVTKKRHMRQKGPLAMAYAGRLDPMASGKLLVLIGDECKKQTNYHGLDKEYEFSVLFGVSSDTGDVLGRLTPAEQAPTVTDLEKIAKKLSGKNISLPYPHFSSRTVKGKPLHMWTLEGRLSEIEIPTYTARIYSLKLLSTETKTGAQIAHDARIKIDTIPQVTEARKALGQDFRRVDIRLDWQDFAKAHGSETYTIATFRCTCGPGAYMRSLAEVIAKEAGTIGLAHHIHRTKIGKYTNLGPISFWIKLYK